MFDAGRRPMGRLFYCALAVVVASGLWVPVSGAASQNGPATTTISDTVYLADGSTAQGTLIISWPAFLTAAGTAVAAGTTNVTLGANGALSVALVPNAGATPAGVYYSVVYQLGPGQVKSESWVVPTNSPANLATVRMTPGAGLAAQPVSIQYVNSELATKADDTAVVHLNGAETISGTKTFSSAPTVPAPTSIGQVANKAYVDQSVANVGAGNYLSTAGGTMSGPITLPSNPVAPLQASTKQYVDAGFLGKADLISGLVPTNELGTGTATAGSCLLGNGTWGACGSGGGSGNVSTTPAASQNVAQPAGTQFSTNNLANVRYVTASWNWVQSPADNLATAGSNTIHLSPCPLGIDTSNNANRPYYVYVAGTGTAETALVTGGTCAGGAASGTIVVTTGSSHGAGYTIGSSTSGVQEALNDGGSVGAAIVIPPTGANANALPIYSTIYVQSNKSSVRGEGKPTLLCKTRSVCLFIGDRVNSNDFGGIEVSGVKFAAGNMFDGIPITNTACSANVSTITLNNTGANAVQAGDYVDINWTFNQHYYGLHLVASASGTQFTYADPNCGGATTIASQASAGFASLENAAIEDNGNGSSLRDIYMADKSSYNPWGVWQNQVVVDNDQAFKLDTMNVDEGTHCTANYCGQAIYFPGPFSTNAGLAWLSHLNFGLACGGNGVTDWAGNTLRIQNSVIQAFAQWGVFDGTMRGGYGGGEFDDVYEEVGGCTNPLYPGAGAQKQAMAGLLNSGGGNTIHGGEFPLGQLPQFAASGNQGMRYNYCFVVHDTAVGVSKCLTIGYAAVDTASPSGNIVVSWPRVQGTGTVTYDVVRYSGPGGAAISPYPGGCGGGSAAACGSVAVAQAQCSSILCSFTDTANASTSNYAVAAPTYTPGIFWLPGGIVTVNSADSSNFGTAPTFLDDNSMVTGVSPITTESGLLVPQVFSQRCSSGAGNEWLSCLAGNSNGNNSTPGATVLQYGPATGGPVANLKGRLNFTSSQSASINSGEIITLVDSNPAKTLATPGNRPAQDAGDTFLGTDSGSVNYPGVGLAIGAPVSISSYINVVPNGTNYLERLTAAGKTFNVPLTVNGNLAVTSGTVTLPITGSSAQCLHVSSTGVLTGTGADCGSGSGGSGTVNSGTAQQVAMYSGNGAVVSGDSALTDDGITLNYSGGGGISAPSGTFSGDLTVNGQLQVAGPWMVSSPIPGTAMAAGGTGTSSFGISNDGNFYVSVNGGTPVKVATSDGSSYSNLWQEDANNLGIYNGTNPQSLHVYSSYTNSSTWQRTALGFDATDGYAVLRSENSGGSAPGLGFWINTGLKWVIDPTSNLKPWVNNAFNVGSPALAPQSIFAATSFDTLTQGRMNFELCNDAASGTALNFLAKYNGASPACAVKAGTSDTDGVIGVVSGGSGTSGNAVISYRGFAWCSFDQGTTAGDYVVASITNAGDCHDAGSTRPSGVQVIGRAESTNAGAGTYAVRVALDSPVGGTGAAPGMWMTSPVAGSNGAAMPSSANKMMLWGVVNPQLLTTTKVTYSVGTADNTANTYDLGIYNSSGALVVHTGSTAGTTFANAGGTHTLNWVTSQTLAPGKYYIGLTSSCTSSCATISSPSASGVVFYKAEASLPMSIATGGSCPASITPPADSPSWASYVPALIVQ